MSNYGDTELPVIRLELERMKHVMMSALMREADELNTRIQKEVEAFCTTEALTHIIHHQVETSVREAVKKAIDSYFKYGAGMELIRATCEKAFAGIFETDEATAD